MILVAVLAVRNGELSGVNLAVLVLIPLVAFEIVVGLPSAALWLAKARASSARIVDLFGPPAILCRIRPLLRRYQGWCCRVTAAIDRGP